MVFPSYTVHVTVYISCITIIMTKLSVNQLFNKLIHLVLPKPKSDYISE